ncbi:MAG: tetratricopeptide repeat protein [Burkholderiaceae bacterium]|nr:tetratricopeptide repeat protein [Burkholderiaceae bacterium]MCD8517343.1 tetratricopeptide repeat protein [Burkholderiaceae bacterium]MCD8537644.1 tetratricopeptide repeat protein [Burkholderiaceae bacterium]MCD8566043.1 tetratricopeptide repeat protein [Burkholderiaceae bacterium]
MRRFRQSVLVVLLALSGTACAQELPRVAQTDGHPPIQAVPKTPPAPQPDRITLKAGELPHVALSADILYKFLASEIAVQRGAILPAANTTLELARETADPRLAQRAVELYAAIGDVQGALQAAEVWVLNSPSDENAQSTRLALSAAAGKTAGLAQALAKQVKASADKIEALSRAISVLRRMQDRQQAFQLLEETIDLAQLKGTLAAYMALADMAQAAGDYERALVEAQKALRLKPDSEDAAMRVLDYGMPVDAVASLDQARKFARAYPKARQLRLMLAGQLAETGDVQGALDELELMSAQYPEDFDLLFVRAQLAYQDNRLPESRGLLLQYVDVQSQRQDAIASGASDAAAALADAYQLLARIAQDQDDPDQAIAWLGRIEEPSARYSARLRQATIRAEQGRIDEAVAMIDAAHPIDQDEQLIGVLTMAQILRNAERYEQAIERLRQADQEIVDSIEIKYELGMLLERQKQYGDMEKYLREVIDLDPGYAHAYNALGYSLADRNVRLDEAYDLIYRAHQILPEDPYILDSLGWVKFRQGDNEQAEKYLRQAYEVKPEAEIAAHLGEVLWVMGEQDKARDVWREGVELDATNPTLKQTLERFGVSQ